MESYTCALLRRQNSGNYHFVTYARCTPEDTIGNAEKKLLADYYNPLCSAFEAEPADSLELYGLMYDIKPDLTESPRQSKERYRVVNDTFLDNYAGGRLPKMLTLKEFKAEYDCEFLGVARVKSPRRTPYYPQEIGTALDVRAGMNTARTRALTSSHGCGIPDNSQSRPLELLEAPVRIYNRAFADFLLEMRAPPHGDIFTPDELNLASRLVAAASAVYSSENHRTETFYNLLMEVVQPEIGRGTSSVRLYPMGARIIGETKRDRFLAFSPAKPSSVSEPSDGFSDPSQAQRSCYIAVYASEFEPFVQSLFCPILLLSSTGTRVRVYGAIFAHDLLVDQLTDDVTAHPDGHIDIQHVAQFIRSTRSAIKKVTSIFATRGTPDTWGQRQLFPFLDDIALENGGGWYVGYKSRLAAQYLQKSVFRATIRARDDIYEWHTVVVKFADTYCKDAHELLAHQSPPLAPKLWHCAWEEQVSMYVVIMDYIAEPATRMVDAPDAVKRTHLESLRTAVETLHAHGWVVGDLREQNVFLCGDSVQLVDFDWAGKEGEARYPYDINLSDKSKIGWHEGVSRGGLIEKEHDEHMLKKIVDLYT